MNEPLLEKKRLNITAALAQAVPRPSNQAPVSAVSASRRCPDPARGACVPGHLQTVTHDLERRIRIRKAKGKW
jgi:hypothetical protein